MFFLPPCMKPGIFVQTPRKNMDRRDAAMKTVFSKKNRPSRPGAADPEGRAAGGPGRPGPGLPPVQPGPGPGAGGVLHLPDQCREGPVQLPDPRHQGAEPGRGSRRRTGGGRRMDLTQKILAAILAGFFPHGPAAGVQRPLPPGAEAAAEHRCWAFWPCGRCG